MTRCDDIQVLLALRPEERSVTEQRRVRAHLAVCAECAARAEAYVEQDRIIRSAPRVALTPSQRAQLISTIERKGRRRRMRSKLHAVAGATAAMAAVIVLIFGVKLLGPSGLEQLIPGVPFMGGGAELSEGRTARLRNVDFAVVGHELTGCVTLDSGEERCPAEGQVYVWVEFIVKNSEHYPTADVGPQISIVHRDQPLPEVVFLPEGKSPRSSCTPEGYYRDEPCQFWVGASVPEVVRTQDLAVRAVWDETFAIWPVGVEEGRVLSVGQFQWPTSRRDISGWSFHDPRNPDHSGIDIAAADGKTIFSIADGKVAFAGPKGDYGNLVVVNHRDGWSSAYAQLQQIEVEVGQAVRQGEPLGRAGSTGNSSGPHLHFELRYDGDPVNPLHHSPAFGEPFAKSEPLIFAGEIRSETRTVDPLTGPPGPALTLGERDPEDPFAPARLDPPAEVRFILRWKVVSAPSTDWRVFAHLVREGTGALALRTDASVDWPDRPCSDDEDGESCTVSSEHAFIFPSDFTSGLYAIEIGLYDRETGRRAWVTSPAAAAGNTSAMLSRVRIVSEDEAFANGDVERELAELLVGDANGECGWEMLGEEGEETYLWAVCEAPSGTAVSAPAVLRWMRGDEGIRELAEVKMPRDGSFFDEDVAALFPLPVQERILDHDVDMDAMWAQIERDLTVVRGTVVDNALSAEAVTLEDEDGERWHVLWGGVSRGIHWSDGSWADFRDLQRGMAVVVSGLPRPEATTSNVLSAVRVMVFSEPDRAASLKNLLLRGEDLPGTAPDDFGGDYWEPAALPLPDVPDEEGFLPSLAQQEAPAAAFQVEGPRVTERQDGSSAVVYVLNAVYAFETPGQASSGYEGLLAELASEPLGSVETLYDGTTEGGMEARAAKFEGLEADAVYWLFGVKEQYLQVLMVNGLDDDATKAFFEATMTKVLTMGSE